MRTCLPLTPLSPQLVEGATLSPQTKLAILIGETEKRMVEGPADVVNAWKHGLSKYRTQVDFSQLEMKILEQQGLMPGSYMHHFSAPRAPSKLCPFNPTLRSHLRAAQAHFYIDTETSGTTREILGRRASLLIIDDSLHTPESAPTTLPAYAARDAAFTFDAFQAAQRMALGWEDRGPSKAEQLRWRRLAINFDQLYGARNEADDSLLVLDSMR